MHDLFELNPDLWVFDCDGTFYPDTSQIGAHVVNLMINFIEKAYGISNEAARELRSALLVKHNTKSTALAIWREGLDYKAFVRETYLATEPTKFGISYSPSLVKLLARIKSEKVILTNNPSEFARNITIALGVEQFFPTILGMEELGFALKPSFESFVWILESGKTAVLIDDSPENTLKAKALGITTVLINKNKFSPEFAHFQMESVLNLGD